ncbi:DUF6538 domain-containing protein [Methylobacterium komagatae]
MALAMARPWKHPDTGIFWLRRAVPADLRALVGKREEKRTLGTRDPSEAKVRHVVEMARLEERWARLRRGVTAEAPPAPSEEVPAPPLTTLTEQQAHERAAWLYPFWLDKHREAPGAQTFWPTELYADLWNETSGSQRFLTFTEAQPASQAPTVEDQRRERLRAWCLDQADDILALRDLNVDEASRLRLARAVGVAVQRASIALQRLALGETWEAQFIPAERTASAAMSARKTVTFDEVLKGWENEKKPAAKTVYEWSREVRQLSAFLGHDDAARVTPEDVVRWKEALIAEGRSAKTINDSKLAAVRTVLQWGVDSRRLPTNPALGVRMDVKRTAKGRRGYTDAEARTILSAAKGETNPVLHWIPLLCAYSGARLSEMCQLRVEDVREIEGIWCMVIDSEAGSVKTASSERTVPLHQAVVDAGFLTFVRRAGRGPLFADLSPDRFGKRGGNGTKMLGRWVRSLGFDDTRLAPNHSWRHRMKTLSRRYRLAEDVTRALMGHSSRSVADSYGEFEIATLHHELMKLPMLVAAGDGSVA